MDQTTDGATAAGPDDVAEGGADQVTAQGMVEEGPTPAVPNAVEPSAVSPPPALPPAPDRADAPVSEVAERFLRAILQRLPLSRIEEVHLFSPLRQGTVETGIAVVAARPAAVIPLEPSLSLEPAEPAEPADPADLAEPSAPSEPVGAPAAPSVRRHEVHTARYRLVIKGPERGKWEEDLVAEADAPLITVETVVRGVQRRAGEATETIRYSAAQVARALRLSFPPA